MTKKSETRNISIFTEKKAVLEVLEGLVHSLDYQLKDATHSFEIVGKKSEQATDCHTGEFLWEDEEHTIPRYDNEWDYVRIPEDELTDEQIAKVHAIEKIRKVIEGMA